MYFFFNKILNYILKTKPALKIISYLHNPKTLLFVIRRRANFFLTIFVIYLVYFYCFF